MNLRALSRNRKTRTCTLRVCEEIIWALCCWPPGPLARRERRAIPGAVCEERATKPAGRSPEGRGGGRASALLPLLDDVRHRLRRGASHLPARRSRQSVHIISLQTLKPELQTMRQRTVDTFRGARLSSPRIYELIVEFEREAPGA